MSARWSVGRITVTDFPTPEPPTIMALRKLSLRVRLAVPSRQNPSPLRERMRDDGANFASIGRLRLVKSVSDPLRANPKQSLVSSMRILITASKSVETMVNSAAIVMSHLLIRSTPSFSPLHKVSPMERIPHKESKKHFQRRRSSW